MYNLYIVYWNSLVRGGMKNIPARSAPEPKPRVEVVEEPTCRMGGPTFKKVQPKTYKILESELPASEEGQGIYSISYQLIM